MPTEPAGTLGRGVARRGTAILGSTVPMYANPGTKPSMKTRYTGAACRAMTSPSVIPAYRATSLEIRSERAPVRHRNPDRFTGNRRLPGGHPPPRARDARSNGRSRCAADRSRSRPSETWERRRGRPRSAPLRSPRPAATTFPFTSASIHSSNSTTTAESPAVTMRKSCVRCCAIAEPGRLDLRSG